MTAEADGSVEKFTAARQRFIDAQLLATWQALLVNPDLDPRHALHVLDQLLDQRARHAAGPPPAAAPLNRTLPTEFPAQHAVLAEVLAMLQASCT